MADKILGEFLNPNWIEKLREEGTKTEGDIAGDLDNISIQSVSNWMTHTNNPTPHYRNMMTDKYGIEFESIKIKELLLKVSHVSNSIVSQNGKRAFLLLVLFAGKMPGAKISTSELVKYGERYGYKKRKIREGIENLERKNLVIYIRGQISEGIQGETKKHLYEFNGGKVSLCFEGCKSFLEQKVF